MEAFTDWIDDNLRLVRGVGSCVVAGLVAAACHRTGRFSRVRSVADLRPEDFGGRFSLRARLHRAVPGTGGSLLAVHQPLGHRALRLGARVSREEVELSESRETLPVRVFGVDVPSKGADAAAFERAWARFVDENFARTGRGLLVAPLCPDPRDAQRVVADLRYRGPSFAARTPARPPRPEHGDGPRLAARARAAVRRALAPLPLRRCLAEELIAAGAAQADVRAAAEFERLGLQGPAAGALWSRTARLEALEEDARRLGRGAWGAEAGPEGAGQSQGP